jgi:UDP-N-acetylmuramoyl-tripeptide--D-alanyl-D-alanine ligase
VQLELSDLAAACDGQLRTPSTGPTSINGVSIDSRSIEAGQLFVPIVAERDGHDFIASALDRGASAYLTSRGVEAGRDGVAAIEVDDTAAALIAVGRLARSRLRGPIIGITGSVGKTSVKDLTLAACDGDGTAWASAASFNNELGVPLTLANAADRTEIAIVEMGARGAGHIATLADIAEPTIGVVTAVALAHSELFGSIDGVAAAKGELVEALPTSGTAVLNADDPRVLAMATRTSASVVTYGSGSDADVRVADVTLDRLLRPTVTFDAADLDGSGPRRTATATLAVSGRHMALNAAGALAAALAAGVEFEAAVDGLGRANLSRWRMEVAEAPSGLVVINDAYNANPTSMRAALDALVSLGADELVAVVGVMAELGSEGPDEHRAVAAEARAAGVRLIAVDATLYGPDAEHVASAAEAEALVGRLGEGAALLVKGSRVAGLESVAAALLDQG